MQRRQWPIPYYYTCWSLLQLLLMCVPLFHSHSFYNSTKTKMIMWVQAASSTAPSSSSLNCGYCQKNSLIAREHHRVRIRKEMMMMADEDKDGENGRRKRRTNDDRQFSHINLQNQEKRTSKVEKEEEPGGIMSSERVLDSYRVKIALVTDLHYGEDSTFDEATISAQNTVLHHEHDDSHLPFSKNKNDLAEDRQHHPQVNRKKEDRLGAVEVDTPHNGGDPERIDFVVFGGDQITQDQPEREVDGSCINLVKNKKNTPDSGNSLLIANPQRAGIANCWFDSMEPFLTQSIPYIVMIGNHDVGPILSAEELLAISSSPSMDRSTVVSLDGSRGTPSGEKSRIEHIHSQEDGNRNGRLSPSSSSSSSSLVKTSCTCGFSPYLSIAEFRIPEDDKQEQISHADQTNEEVVLGNAPTQEEVGKQLLKKKRRQKESSNNLQQLREEEDRGGRKTTNQRGRGKVQIMTLNSIHPTKWQIPFYEGYESISLPQVEALEEFLKEQEQQDQDEEVIRILFVHIPLPRVMKMEKVHGHLWETVCCQPEKLPAVQALERLLFPPSSTAIMMEGEKSEHHHNFAKKEEKKPSSNDAPSDHEKVKKRMNKAPVNMIVSGHDHVNDAIGVDPETGVLLAFGRRSGFGNYGWLTPGVRLIEVRWKPDNAAPGVSSSASSSSGAAALVQKIGRHFEIHSWIRDAKGKKELQQQLTPFQEILRHNAKGLLDEDAEGKVGRRVQIKCCGVRDNRPFAYKIIFLCVTFLVMVRVIWVKFWRGRKKPPQKDGRSTTSSTSFSQRFLCCRTSSVMMKRMFSIFRKVPTDLGGGMKPDNSGKLV